MPRSSSVPILTLVCLWLCAPGSVSFAQTDPAALRRADELFQNGKFSLAAGEVSAACEMFAASYEIDPATGSLLALAMCHEREGKLASAVREYRQIVEGANQRTRPDRLQAASSRIDALTPLLSTLTIVLDPQTDGANPEVRLNGQIVPASQWGKPMPMDAGSVLVTASAPNTRTFAANLTIAPRGTSETLRVPVLAPEVAPRPIAAIPIVRPVSSSVRAGTIAPIGPTLPVPARALSAMDWTGIGIVTAGAVTLAAGGMLTLRRIHDDHVRDSGCTPRGCVEDPEDKPLRLHAADKAILVGGAMLSVTGASVLIWEHRNKGEVSVRRAAFALPWAVPHAAGAVLHGRF